MNLNLIIRNQKICFKNISTQVFRAFLENAASEQGSRMTAMDNATRNAGDLVDKLTINYNSETSLNHKRVNRNYIRSRKFIIMNKNGKITQIIGAVVDVNLKVIYQKFILPLK